MKKLALIVIIAALSTLMSAAVASDSGHNWWDYNPYKYFHGTYEMIASGSCSHSEAGWKGENGKFNLEATPPLYPVDPAQLYVGTTVTYGTWTFNKDGTGEYTIRNYATILPGGSYPKDQPFLKTQDPPTTKFTFVVNSFGDITVDAAGIQIIGSISIDKNTMTLSNGNQVQDFTAYKLGWAVCNSARTLIKVGN
jgi:hypothetical protein